MVNDLESRHRSIAPGARHSRLRRTRSPPGSARRRRNESSGAHRASTSGAGCQARSQPDRPPFRPPPRTSLARPAPNRDARRRRAGRPSPGAPQARMRAARPLSGVPAPAGNQWRAATARSGNRCRSRRRRHRSRRSGIHEARGARQTGAAPTRPAEVLVQAHKSGDGARRRSTRNGRPGRIPTPAFQRRTASRCGSCSIGARPLFTRSKVPRISTMRRAGKISTLRLTPVTCGCGTALNCP